MTFFDAVFLARLQFAFTVGFHIIFPSFTIGLAAFLAFIEWRWLRTRDEKFKELYKFWIKVFAVAFGMGVVSGVVMSYQFGTNWSAFSDKVGNVIGPLLGFEVLTAFFLEASFLGIMLFGWGKVSERMHFTATCIVAGGTLLSAFWILSVNSWMQTPQGFIINHDGRLYPNDWLEIIFNPSFHYRLFHMILASYLTTSFFIGGVASMYLLQKKHIKHAKTMLYIVSVVTVVLSPIQILVGDAHGLNTLKYQPAKIAAMEAIWDTEKEAGLRLFAIPDEKEQKNHYEIQVPRLASIILTHSLDGEVRGLKEWDKSEIPPVAPVFYSFRIMVGIGVLMLILSITSIVQYIRGRLFTSKFIQRFWVTMMPSGFIALIAGWCVTEIGRQPYIVYGIVRVSQGVSPAIHNHQVAWSLLAFVVAYTLVFGSGSYYIAQLIRKGIAVIVDKEQFYSHGIESSIMNAATEKNRRK